MTRTEVVEDEAEVNDNRFIVFSDDDGEENEVDNEDDDNHRTINFYFINKFSVSYRVYLIKYTLVIKEKS